MAPIEVDSTNLISYIETLIANNQVTIFSKSYCPYCNKVKELFTELNVEFFSLELDLEEKGSEIQVLLEKKTGQKTVPSVFVNGSHLGGCDSTLKAHSEGTLSELLSSEKYDYDLIVIGGGSGGLSASKEASLLGKKVAVCDFVKPSPKGTSWGLGGTCVNVGCIPKKLMHQAATLGHLIRDSNSFGWELPEEVNHTWEKMRENVQNYIYGLNWGYRVQLREKGVEYLNAFAEFTGPHTIKTTDKRNRVKTVTSRHFILAMGGRPKYPEIPGVEYCISSDDVFSLPNSPGRTLVVGASYVALECAGFLAGIGLDTTVVVRSILLRGFDQDMANRIGVYMEENGVKFIRGSVPTKIEEISAGEPGLYRVSLQGEDGEITTGEYNTVLVAIGRDPCTASIGLDTVGVKLNPRNGKVVAVNDQSNVPYIYAIGDILDGRPELTPVAIQAGKLLARRLYAGSNIQCDYIYVPTTVFTPIEYGTIGYSEEDALAKFGEENIEVYHKNFVPLEYTVPKRNENDCYSKIICLKSESEKVVGFHYLGPNAGEITQGFALGIKMGATKNDFDNLIGIHPTVAETFTMMTVTKRSGASVKAGGC